MFIAVSLLLVFCVGCDEGHGRQLPQDRQSSIGTKLFGERTLKDGTKTVERIELPNGQKWFDATTPPDGTEKVGRIEDPNGGNAFDVTRLLNGTVKDSLDLYVDEFTFRLHAGKVQRHTMEHLDSVVTAVARTRITYEHLTKGPTWFDAKKTL